MRDIEAFVQSLGNQMDYSRHDTTFSPLFSDVGLSFNDNPGIDCLRFHYNRRTREVGRPFLSFNAGSATHTRTVLRVDQKLVRGTLAVAFYGHNSWLVVGRELPALEIDLTGQGVDEVWRETQEGAQLFLGYITAADERDPDDRYPFVVGIRLLTGTVGEEGEDVLAVTPDDSGLIILAMTAAVSEIDREEVGRRLAAAPPTIEEAADITATWLSRTLGHLTVRADDPAELQVLATAAYTLAANSTVAPGALRGRIASFPSRGGYPTHFLWDSCFHVLALEDMDPRLAEDALLLLTENLRPDGKMAHFLCSTWMRPQESQPPLVGWAGRRLVRRRKSASLAAQLLPALLRNIRWWLSYRMTRYGLISCRNPLETGWDDTPRLDKGPVLALDMNSYLLLQMRACAELAALIGQEEIEQAQTAQADRYAQMMVELLYDREANLFRDVLVETGEMLSIVTPAAFLPLLAGVPLEESKVIAMIEETLLAPEKLYGRHPFPCVAYDEESYQPEQWWRGPTWMPVSYFMLEVLRKYGYAAERREAAGRLYRMIVEDGYISELFNSQTGEGMGRRQQGWTAAILFALKRIKDGE